MNLVNFLTQITILAIAGVIVFLIAYFFIKADAKKYLYLKNQELNAASKASLLTLRLQAHERLIVFVERINPLNLFIRLHQQGLTAKDLQAVILTEIRAEYQHNVSQQLYLSTASWQLIKKLKDDTITIVNHVVINLPEQAQGIDLSKNVLQHLSQTTENHYDLTINFIKKDIEALF